jgi:hypothetical protein
MSVEKQGCRCTNGEKMRQGKAVAYVMGAVLPLLISFMAIPVVAQPMSEAFGVNDAAGNPGTLVNVPVEITNVSGGTILCVIFDLNYDSSVLSLNAVQRGELTATWDDPTVNTFLWGARVLLVYDGAGDHAIADGSTGSVAFFNFYAGGSPGSSSAMNVSNIQLAGGALEYLVGTAPARNGVFHVDAGAPTVSDPSTNPGVIQADGVQETRLNVTVGDDSAGEVTVTVNVMQLGGSAAKTLEKISDMLYSTTTTADPGTSAGLYYLPITATDALGNSNGTEVFRLTVEAPPAGSVTGAITRTCNGTGIVGATVNLTQTGSLVDSVETQADGTYAFNQVTPGGYVVIASKLRFWENSTAVTALVDETATVNLVLWLKGDLNNNCLQADAGDLAMMKAASVGQLTPDWRYDLNWNGIYADAGDLAMMKAASVGELELL